MSLFELMRKNFLSRLLIALSLIHLLSFSVQAAPPNFVDTSTFTPAEGGFVSNLGAQTQSPTEVTSAGDFNGDGYEDILIGAYLAHENSVSTGLAYVVFGTATGIPNIDFDSMTVAQGIRIRGAPAGADLGLSVEGVGDVTGDGIDDVMVGAYGLDTVFVIFGKRTGLTDFDVMNFDNSQGMKIEGELATLFGYQIKNVGDLNNDGFNDIVITATSESTASIFSAGRVYVIFGQSTGLSSMTYPDLTSLASAGRGFRITGNSQIDHLGMSVSKAGDVNQDGIPDLMIGTISTSCLNGDSNCGAVIVIYGSHNSVISDIDVDTLTLTQGFKIIGGISAYPIGFPGSMIAAGDCNNDGIDDLILPIYYAPDDFSGALNVGLVYVIFGKAGGLTNDIDLSSLSNSQGYTMKGQGEKAFFGSSATRGDIDGNGKLDLILVSAGANLPNPSHGVIYVIFDGLNGATNLDFSNEASLPYRIFKFYVDGQLPSEDPSILATVANIANDLNGDGVNDILATGTSGAYAIYGSKCDRDTQCSAVSPMCDAARGCSFCVSCPDSCLTCTSFSTCQSCKSGFLLQVGSCVSACSQGYTNTQDGSTCIFLPSDIKTINSITKVTDTFDSATLTAASVVASQDPGSVTAGMLTKMLQYIKYLNLPYSNRLELTFKSQNSIEGPFGSGPDLPKQTLAKLPLHPIPLRFLEFNVHSSFLVNFWDSLIFISIIFSSFLLLKFIEWSIEKIKDKPVLHPIIRKIRAVLQNFFFMQFYNAFGDVLLFSTLELKTLSFDNVDTIISFCLSILFLCIGCIIMAIHICILLRFYTLRKIASWLSKIEGLYKIYEGSEVFFKHFKNKSVGTQSFLLIFVLRNGLYNIILVLLADYALVQTTLILTLTLVMLAYLLIQRPFSTLVNLLQQIICEVLFLIVNTCVFIIAQLNLNETSYYTRDKLCDVIIYVSLVFTFVPKVFLGIKIVVAVIEWHQTYRKKPKQSNNKRISEVRINKRFQNNMLQPPQHHDQSLNDSTTELAVVQNSTFSMHTSTHNSSSASVLSRENSPFQTNNVRRNIIKKQSNVANMMNVSGNSSASTNF